MSETLRLQLDGARIEFDVWRVIVAGYTGRDPVQVRVHIEELEKQGIPAPDSVPAVYPLAASCATTDDHIVVNSPYVSGEVEPALLFRTNNLSDALVSVIVDFTDRNEERRSIPQSKIQPKPLSAQVWKYVDVANVWDEIALRSWTSASDSTPYQSGKFKQLLAPGDLLARLNLSGSLEGVVLLMGTVPLLSGEFSFTDYFACEIEAPGKGTLSYACKLQRGIASTPNS